MPVAKQLHGWYVTGGKWLPLKADSSGRILIDSSNLFEDSPTNGETKKGPTSNWAYDHAAATLSASVHPIAANVDFKSYQAIAMCCENGATFPSSPADGMWFRHQPTGRDILYQYDSATTAWKPIISFGDMTVYVDKTDGTDDLSKGTGVDSNAFKTGQYAVDLIPVYYSGNIIINFNAETYSETITIQGKYPTGAYTITLQGTLTAHATNAQTASTKGADAAYGTISDTVNDPFTGHVGDLLYSSNNNEYRVIETVTSEVATIVGYWTATPSGNYTIYQWGTVVTNIKVGENQVNVIVNDISITAPALSGARGSKLYFYRCKFTDLLYSEGLMWVTFCYCYQTGAKVTVQSFNGLLFVDGCLIWCTNNGGYGLYASNMSMVRIANNYSQPCVLDGETGVEEANYGLYADGGSALNAGYVYNKIRNWDIGCYAINGGSIYYTALNQYAGNDTNEQGTAAQYAFVD